MQLRVTLLTRVRDFQFHSLGRERRASRATQLRSAGPRLSRSALCQLRVFLVDQRGGGCELLFLDDPLGP
jgi:hypothetical protein